MAIPTTCRDTIAYHTRPPYPEAVFDTLAGLLGDRPGALLDAGCGTGVIARRMVMLAERVDAIDISPAMIATGKRLANGDDPGLSWIVGRVEVAPLHPPYTMVTAAASLHWMDWDAVLPRFHDLLTPSGLLVIIGDRQIPPPWHHELLPVLARYSMNQEFRAGFDLVNELQARELFSLQERRQSEPVSFVQSIDAYVESFHARNGFSRDRMDATSASAFDTAVRTLVSRYSADSVELQIMADVTRGRPRRPV